MIVVSIYVFCTVFVENTSWESAIVSDFSDNSLGVDDVSWSESPSVLLDSTGYLNIER